MLRKTAVVLITALTFGGAALLTTAYARGTGGGGGGGRDGGGGHALGAGPMAMSSLSPRAAEANVLAG